MRLRFLSAGLLVGLSAFAQPGDAPVSAASQPARPNRLEHATSPYLQQHANNPVDWYEWGPEALELARRLDKPIFLSIGYSACHWCHVMAHESFEDADIAAVMNELFVNVKVDREERPDLDEIYMRATVILNQGQGGWPMSVWLTPELEPFFAGTYFPPETRWGRPGFRQICARIGELWSVSREGLMTDARRLSAAVADSLQASASQGVFTLDEIDRACVALGRHFDPVHGGISGGGTNKFPPSMTLELFLRYVRRHGPDSGEARRLLDLTRVTLDAMANGGIYDHLGGGFCRYSTDVEWHVPHFEKMLYDQALVGRIYTDAFLCLREPRYERVARGVFDYVLGDLTAPEGGFYSSRDADSEGEEGRYYVWTFEEIEATLGDDSRLFSAYYDVRPEGNWRDPHSPQQPKNVLRNLQPLERVAGEFGLTPGVAERRLDAARKKLLEVRSRRVAPHRDEKILVEWNGLMISALARGGAAFDEPRYTEAARKAAGFLLEHQRNDGRLRRAWRDGRRLEMAFLTDYACLIEGLLDLYEATFERRWYEAALELTHTVGRHYWDQAGGGYFFTADDHEALLTRTRDARDGATPSGNSVMLLNLLRLTAMSGDDALRAKAERMMSAFHGDISGSIGAAERFLAGVELALVGTTEVAIIGPLSESGTGALLRTVRGAWTPNRVLMHLDPSRAQDAPASPLLENRTMPDGRPAAYVCRNYVCLHPVTTAAELARQLATDGRADR